MDSTDQAVGTQESYREATEGGRGDEVKLWLDAIEIATKEEVDWRKSANTATNLYRQDTRGDSGEIRKKFNILHSNIETLVPALYNSTPVPDVRRRFNDNDPVAKQAADIQERCLSYSVDAYDFDHEMRLVVKDSELCGRGVARVRYIPYANEGEEGGIAYQEVTCEHVPWKHFRRGPGQEWPDVPWIAFELFLTREQCEKLNPKLGSEIKLDVEMNTDTIERQDGRNVPEVFKRARIWEIWDKERRQILFLAESYKDDFLRVEDDPLELDGFFPIPRPIYSIETSDSLIPVVPYDIYRSQAEELERVSQRIVILTEAVKAKAIYDARLSEMEKLEDADDTDHIPLENTAIFADGTKLADHVMFYPTKEIVEALKNMYEAREQIKATIYEITGISDILRGQSSPSETATAQNIKQQWGSLRIQVKQAEIARHARDLFRLKAELFATKFEPQVLMMISGIKLPTQADKQQAQMIAARAQQMQQPVPPQLQTVLSTPSLEEVMTLLRSDKLRCYRVDIESDSTIRADLTRNQQNMTLFLQGVAQYAQAMGPIVMAYPQVAPAAMEVFSAFARNFKLGKQAEDALDKVSQISGQLANQPQKEDPAMVKAKADIERDKAELQIKAAEGKQKLAFDQQKHQQDMAFDREKHGLEMEMKRGEMIFDMQMKDAELVQGQQQHDQQMIADLEKHKVGLAMKREQNSRR